MPCMTLSRREITVRERVLSDISPDFLDFLSLIIGGVGDS